MKAFRPLLFTIALAPVAALAQITIGNTLNPAQLITDVLVGQGVSVSNITFNGAPVPAAGQPGAGTFQASLANFPFSEGIVLSSGLVSDIPQNSNVLAGGILGTGSDPDLLMITTPGNSIADRTVIEFDFVPTGDSLKFNYVFASEEYPVYNCNATYNDVFGFFLSGPGISGPYSNNAINIALVPGTNLPVSIANIHGPETIGCAPANAEYYVHNEGNPQLVFGGHTTMLTAMAQVVCGETYHIKLAIGDAGDSGYDSAVFFDAGSFASVPIIPTLQPGPGIVGDTIYESCFPVALNFVRLSDPTISDTLFMQISGTATPGEDYAPAIPDTVIFEPGITTIPYPMEFFIDPDGDETVVIEVLIKSQCSEQEIYAEFTFYIKAPPPLVAIGGAYHFNCGDEVQLQPTLSGGYGLYSLQWPDGSSGASHTVSPTESTDYYIPVQDTCGIGSIAYFAVGLNEIPQLTATLSPSILREGCDEGVLTVQRPAGSSGDVPFTITGGGAAEFGVDYTLVPSGLISAGTNSASFVVQAVLDDLDEEDEDFTITMTQAPNACGQTGSVTVGGVIQNVGSFDLLTENMVVECGNDSIPLVAIPTGGVSPISYVWEHDGSTDALGYGNAQYDLTYRVTAVDACGVTAVGEIFVDILCDLIIPNVFTPNGDGINDRWVIQGIEASRNTVRVLNRWGQVVFSSSNYRNNWNGSDLPDGTYFYEIIVDDKPYTGHVSILANGR